jgi:DNA-binding NarL/FixJ family response regulator
MSIEFPTGGDDFFVIDNYSFTSMMVYSSWKSPSLDKEKVLFGSRKVVNWVSSISVLVVEDFAAFRQFVTATLASMSELQVIGEASDGLEAVQKAQELQPDLILLDIGLPSLNGIEAARRIRKIAPCSKIIFVTQESSADVVQAAVDLGTLGYVVKANAGRDLVAAIEAVLLGNTFISHT